MLEENVIFQDKIMTRKDCGSETGTRNYALIVVRVDTKLRIVGHFIHTFFRSRTNNM